MKAFLPEDDYSKQEANGESKATVNYSPLTGLLATIRVPLGYFTVKKPLRLFPSD